jgi:tetratricopeptide (TPR) repeat protein
MVALSLRVDDRRRTRCLLPADRLMQAGISRYLRYSWGVLSFVLGSDCAASYVALESLAKDPMTLDQPPAAITLLVGQMERVPSSVRYQIRPIGLELLRGARTRYPSDWWISFKLASFLAHTSPGAASSAERARRKEEIIGCYRIALAMRPDNLPLYHALGSNLLYGRRYDEAAAIYRQALCVFQGNARSCTHGRGSSLLKKGGASPSR